MQPRNIKLRYAGMVNFISNLISVFTGLMFVTMVSRRLTDSEFGLWSFLGVFLQYFIIPSSITNYWLTRYAGRGYRVGKTGLILNSGMMLISFVLFSFLSPMVLGGKVDLYDLPLLILILSLQLSEIHECLRRHLKVWIGG